MNILVVEDDALIALAVAEALEQAGHQVLGRAETAKQALDLVRQARPDLALLNINLREGGDGGDLSRILLVEWGVRSLFISGQRMRAYAARDTSLGYVGKPCSPDTIVRSVEVVQAILNGNHPGQMPTGLELFRQGLPPK